MEQESVRQQRCEETAGERGADKEGFEEAQREGAVGNEGKDYKGDSAE